MKTIISISLCLLFAIPTFAQQETLLSRQIDQCQLFFPTSDN